ncbi:MAG: hypothetical protein CFE26_16310 [Verrucomicrobiales bacterium VVV1]|nr:MAG: hypothetical protein CFE26_16310 [Verrucomicrobiales bacterium VVV1]
MAPASQVLAPLPPHQAAQITVQLGATVRAVITARVSNTVRSAQQPRYAFDVQQADGAWSQCVSALQRSQTHRELALAA